MKETMGKIKGERSSKIIEKSFAVKVPSQKTKEMGHLLEKLESSANSIKFLDIHFKSKAPKDQGVPNQVDISVKAGEKFREEYSRFLNKISIPSAPSIWLGVLVGFVTLVFGSAVIPYPDVPWSFFIPWLAAPVVGWAIYAAEKKLYEKEIDKKIGEVWEWGKELEEEKEKMDNFMANSESLLGVIGIGVFIGRQGGVRLGTLEQVKEWKKIDIGMQNNFAELSPRDFEEFIANLFAKMGFEVELTSFVRDFGADIVAKKGKDAILVQVKKYGAGHNVGARDVQRTLGSMWKYKANKSILVTTSNFTAEAEEQAREAPIELWDRDLLYEMIDRHILSVGPAGGRGTEIHSQSSRHLSPGSRVDSLQVEL